MFSGGVAEYIYGRQQTAFGDLGRALAAAVRRRVAATGIPIQAPRAGIRATVLGAAQYAVQVSGSTIKLAAHRLLPLRGIPVAGPPLVVPDVIVAGELASQVRTQLALVDAAGPVAIPVAWAGSATYERLDAFAKGILRGAADVVAGAHPIVLVFDEDIGLLVGRHFELELNVPYDIVCIDCLELRQFDFIDVGAPLDGATAVPVVIKSLVFGAG
jgi:ethanolamine utilization protein EutA